MVSKLLKGCLVMMVCAAASSAVAEPVHLKLAYFNSDTDSTWVGVLRPFIDAVNAEGKGIVEIQGYPNGALSRNTTQQPQIVLDGLTDIAFATLGQSAGRFPDNTVLELPGVFANITESTYSFTRLVEAGKMRGYNDFVVLGAFGNDPSALHTNVPIRSYKDLAGKKIRSSGSTEAHMLRTLGAAPIVMPTAETAEAIARGTLNGTIMSAAPLVDFGVDRIVNFHYYGRFSNAALAVLMNKQKFDSLPPNAQAILRKYSGDWLAARWIEATGGANEKALARFKADPKQVVIFPPEAELAELQNIYKGAVEEFVSKNPRQKELFADLQAVLAKIRADKKSAGN